MSLLRKTLLFMSPAHFQACAWDGGNLVEEECFGNDLSGREQFSAFLKQHREPAYLLADVIEEDFRLETIPHVTGKNRRDLVARKFEQYYRNTPFRQAGVLCRQTEGRRDDEMLFSALTNPQRILPWLDTLSSNTIPLAGIYSLPNISTPLLAGITSDHVLLVSWEKYAGLRQTYFHQKRLHFSRLTPISLDDSFIKTVTGEIPRAQQYLKSLSLPSPGEILDVYIICHTKDKPALAAQLQDTPDLHYSYLDIQALGNSLKTNTACEDSDSTLLFLHLLAIKSPANQYANSAQTHFYLLWKLRWFLYGLAAAVLFTSIFWSALSVWQGRNYVAETEPILTQTAQLARQTADISSQFPVTAIPASDMKTAVALVQSLGKYSPLPEEILFKLGSVLDQFERILLVKLSWQTAVAEAKPSAYPAQVITFEGELLDFGSDYRSELAYLERFQQQLSLNGYTVTAQLLPLDISPKGSISDELQLKSDKTSQFTLKLVWRQPE